MSRFTRRAAFGLAALALLFLSGCASDAPQDTFKPEGSEASSIDKLARPVFIIAGVVGVIVFAVVAFVMFRFRERKGAEDEIPEQIHGRTLLEIGWTIAPAVLLMGIAVPTVNVVFDLAEKPDDPIIIDVIGQQWWWEFDYPAEGANVADGIEEPIITANVMVMPVDRPVYLRITSRDVIHSFWLPRLNGKKDAVPNRVHYLSMTAEKEGEFWGQCAEFCGLSHANMRIRAFALNDADWKQWIADQQQEAATPTDEAALAGQEAFLTAGCAGCHTIKGVNVAEDVPLAAGAAPDLTHLMSRNVFAGALFDLKLDDCDVAPVTPSGTPVECLNVEELKAWLRNPPAEKPMAAGEQRGMPNLGLSEEQIDALVAYLSTLK